VFSRAAKTGSTSGIEQIDIPIKECRRSPCSLMQNFVDAVLDGTPLLVPGEEGLHSVELANVMLYSS